MQFVCTHFIIVFTLTARYQLSRRLFIYQRNPVKQCAYNTSFSWLSNGITLKVIHFPKHVEKDEKPCQGRLVCVYTFQYYIYYYVVIVSFFPFGLQSTVRYIMFVLLNMFVFYQLSRQPCGHCFYQQLDMLIANFTPINKVYLSIFLIDSVRQEVHK